MEIALGPELETALTALARRRGVTPEDLALDALRERFLVAAPRVVPQDEWERRVLGAASDCGVSLPHAALSSEEIYD